MTGIAIAQVHPSIGRKLRAYITLTKPRIMVLLLTTTAAAMFLAAYGWPPLGTFVITLVGGALGAGGASAVNNFMDRDIDDLMLRTRSRPVPSGTVSPIEALCFGIGLIALSFVLLALAVNLLAAALTLAGALFYIFVYTGWLKRSSVNGVVIGGAAGAIPPMVGWAAVTGDLSLLAYLLFATIFIWTPPHFWALSLLMKDEYQRARVPMLPVVKGELETQRQISIYSIALITFTLAIAPFAPFGAIYLASAAILGAIWLYLSTRLLLRGTRDEARDLFHYSILYLALLFVAMVADRQIIAVGGWGLGVSF
jgi:protoheme IX farnesyltransferase